MFHAYGTNLQFDEGEYNFVKARSQVGTREAFARARTLRHSRAVADAGTGAQRTGRSLAYGDRHSEAVAKVLAARCSL